MIYLIFIFIFSLIFLIKHIPISVKPYKKIDTNSISYKKLRAKRLKSTNFPNPFPNSWYFVCNSFEISIGKIKSFNICGEEIVIYRTFSGKIGVLTAYCPHLGTHLGHGGNVSGETVKCPYHDWEFDINGICKYIPYCNKKLTSRLNTKSYHTIEKNHMIFIWYNSSNEEPINQNIKILDNINSDFTYIFNKDFEDFHMHIMEPSQNSADWYHFKTVHNYLPIPFFKKLIWVNHEINPIYTNLLPISEPIHNMYHGSIIIEEKVVDMQLLKLFPLPKFLFKIFNTQVIIESPSLILFNISIPYIGIYKAIMTLQPIDPYIQKIKMNVWAKGLPMKLISRILTFFVMSTVEQDRQVWENKMQTKPRNIVSGDGPWASYSKWLNKFYDENSKNSKDLDITW